MDDNMWNKILISSRIVGSRSANTTKYSTEDGFSSRISCTGEIPILTEHIECGEENLTTVALSAA